MGQVIPFKRKEQIDPVTVKMLEVSDEIDALILKHLADGALDPKDMAGLLAHRLGALMNHMHDDEKVKLWDVCEKVLKRQANLHGAI